MYRAYKRKRMRTKNIVVGLTFLILAVVTIVIKVVYGNSLGPSLASTTLANSGILATQSENMQTKRDIRHLQASLEDVLKQYQEVINSTNKKNKGTLVSEVDKLYSIAASDNTTMKSFEGSSNNKQIIDDLTQFSYFLAASLFEMKDSMIYEGDFSATQLKNSKDDLTHAIEYLELVRQEPKN
ncbi:MAG: hypothetical protein ACYCV0_11995 [Desulfitobacteriaceae bacterium]